MTKRSNRLDPAQQHARALASVPDGKIAPNDAPAKDVGPYIKYVAPAILFLCVVAFVVLAPQFAFIAAICLALISPCVMLHEYAHLLAARATGMVATEFSIGFGPRLRSTTRNGLRWSLKALPFGGSTDIAGMTVEDVQRTGCDPDRAFIYKSPGARLVVVLAGILTNVLLAWVFLTAAVIMVVPHDHAPLSFYLLAPIQGLVMIGRLAVVGAQGLLTMITDWSGSDVSSILMLPRSFAVGAASSMDMGIPVAAYLALFLGAMNLSLALFNILPLYPMDGYHAATAVVDGARRIITWFRGRPFAPLSTWRLRWFSRSSGTVLALFVCSVFVKDIVRMM